MLTKSEKLKRLRYLLYCVSPHNTTCLCPLYSLKYGSGLRYDIPELFEKRDVDAMFPNSQPWWHYPEDRYKAIVETIKELSL